MEIPSIWDEERFLEENPDLVKLVEHGRYSSGWHQWKSIRAQSKRRQLLFLRKPGWISQEQFSKRIKTHYVLAAWSGDRRNGNDPYLADCTFYLKRHIEYLQKIKHSLSHITVAVPENISEPVSFTSYLETIPNKIQNAEVSIVRRPNIGQSYGSYSDVYKMHRTEFDYYIFIEDDYSFVKDHFDFEMIKEFESKKNCGYLCSYSSKWNRRLHAAVSNGISRSDVLEKIIDRHGLLPHTKNSSHIYDPGPQVGFSFAFLDVGYRIHDYLDMYKTPFNHVGRLVFFGNKKYDSIIVPLQFDLEKTR